jgi:UDP-GlcNAc3NAcA epimerase
MITLLSHCQGVFTDSGGLQKEAFFFHKPCVTLRDETEWVELVEHGFNILVGANEDKILQSEQNFIKNKRNYLTSLYGNGKAGDKIVEILAKGLTNLDSSYLDYQSIC